MFFTGLADEAGTDVADQISATRELGWTHIEARQVNGTMIHDLPDEEFDRACDALDAAGVRIAQHI